MKNNSYYMHMWEQAYSIGLVGDELLNKMFMWYKADIFYIIVVEERESLTKNF